MLLFLFLLCNSPFVIKFSVDARKNSSKGINEKTGLYNGTIFNLAQSLLNGTLEELRKLPRNSILKSLKELEDLAYSLDRKLILWEIIKDHRPPQTLNATEIEQIGSLIESIPETDLFNFNVSDWKIVDYLGTYPRLRRRQTGIVGYAIKQRWGDNITRNIEILLKIKGLICGFSRRDLQSIPNEVFHQLDKTVFDHVVSCTKRQLQVMINKATRNLVHGPPQVWEADTCKNLSRLIKSLSLKDLETIRPVAMAGIDPETIQIMTIEQLLIFSDYQVKHMKTKTLSMYRKITGILRSSSKNLVCQTFFTFIVYKLSLIIVN